MFLGIYATYFINMDALCLDGDISKASVKRLLKLQKAGAKFVAFTSEDKTFADNYKQMLLQHGINVAEVVGNCSHSGVIRVINSKEKLNNYALEF